METRAEFLKSVGGDLARYQADRVARIGCLTGLGLAAGGILLGVTGVLIPPGWVDPIFPDFFRLVVFLILGGTLAVFLIFSLLEGLAERKATTRLREYLSREGTDALTLLEMARTRQGRFDGSERVIALLERASGE